MVSLDKILLIKCFETVDKPKMLENGGDLWVSMRKYNFSVYRCAVGSQHISASCESILSCILNMFCHVCHLTSHK